MPVPIFYLPRSRNLAECLLQSPGHGTGFAIADLPIIHLNNRHDFGHVRRIYPCRFWAAASLSPDSVSLSAGLVSVTGWGKVEI